MVYRQLMCLQVLNLSVKLLVIWSNKIELRIIFVALKNPMVTLQVHTLEIKMLLTQHF